MTVLFHTKKHKLYYEGVLKNGFNPEYYGIHIYHRLENEHLLTDEQIDVFHRALNMSWDDNDKKAFDALGFRNASGDVITAESMGVLCVYDEAGNYLCDASELDNTEEGYFDFDGSYNCFKWLQAKDCDVSQGKLIILEEMRFNGKYANIELLSELTGLSEDVVQELVEKGILLREWEWADGNIPEDILNIAE